MTTDLMLLCIWLAAGLYLLLSSRWRRRRAGRDLVRETEGYLAGWQRGRELAEQGVSEEEAIARMKEESRRWARSRKWWRL